MRGNGTRRDFLRRTALVGGVGTTLGEGTPLGNLGERSLVTGRASVAETFTVRAEPGGSDSFELDMSVGEKSPVDAVDVVFCFDLTSSMNEEVDTVKARATDIMGAIGSADIDAAFGVSGFMDYPGSYDSYGYEDTYGASGDYPWRVHEQVTTDIDQVSDAINDLDLGRGRDRPESYTRALYELENGNVGWRPRALRISVLFGDAKPHDDDFHEEASKWGSYSTSSTGGDPGRDGEMFTSDDLDFQTVVEDLDVTVIGVNSGGDDASWRYVAEKTGGAYYDLEDASDIPSTVIDLVGGARNEVTLTLEPAVGYRDWFEWSPERHTDVGAGATRSFSVQFTPPEDASLGTKEIPLYGLADRSQIETFTVDASVYGETSRPVPVSDIGGAGPHLEERLATYRWYQKSFEKEFWLEEGIQKLEYFRSDFQSGLTDIESLVAETASEAAGAGYYSDAALAAKEAVTLSGTLKAWGIGVMENRARSNIPRRRKRVAGIADPAGAVDDVIDLLTAESGDGTEGNVDDALTKLDAVVTYLEAWRAEVQNIEIETDYEAKMDSDEETVTLDASEGASRTVEFSAGEDTQTVSWHVDEKGWLPRYGTYEVTVEVPGKGSETVETDDNGGAIRLLGSPSFAPPEEGDTIRFSIGVVDPPSTPVPEFISTVDEIGVSVDMNYNFRITEDTSEDSAFRDLAEEMRRANRDNAVRHLTSAIEFFTAEKELLAPDEMTGAKVASPVDLHVETADGKIGAMYDGDDTVSGVETSLSADYLYTGPESEPEGVALMNTSGEFDVTIKGRGEGTYDLTVVDTSVTEAGTETETVEEYTGVPTDGDAEDRISLSVPESDDESPSVEEEDIATPTPEPVAPGLSTGPMPDNVPVFETLFGLGVFGTIYSYVRFRKWRRRD
jgi:hypothetical protein